jgi:Ca-activated chloride channel family protein
VQGRYSEAARVYRDPVRQGLAWYRAGDFKQAAAAFGQGSSPEAAFDQGNSLLMLGKYEPAIASYTRALSLRAGWKEAEENLAVAQARQAKLENEGGEGTGGKLGADAIVFGKGKKGESTEVAGGPPLSDEELRGLWLRRVQTQPADFLRAKFGYQQAQRSGGAP